jgi:hypothetical protein
LNIYTIIFAALAVFVVLRLLSVLGQRTGNERPFRVSAFTYRLSMIASVLCAVHYVAYEAKWYAAIEARVTPIISGPARVVDNGTVVIVGLLLAMALCTTAALSLSFLHWKARKALPVHPGLSDQKAPLVHPELPHQPKPAQGDHLKKAKPLDGLLRDGLGQQLNKPRPTEEKHVAEKIGEISREAGERSNRLFESTKDLSPEEQVKRVNEHFGVFGGARPPEGRGRRGKRP